MNSETTDTERAAGGGARALEILRHNPITAVVLVASVAGGIFGALQLPVEDLSMTRRVLGGAVVGAWFGLFPLGARLYRGD